jgi:hypothetical protein
MKKAIINFFRAMLRRNIVVAPGHSNFEILHISKEAQSLTEALGIPEDRADELGTACERAYVSSKDTISAMNKVAVLCNHINEYFFCSTVINQMQTKSRDPIIGLLGMLGKKD